MNHIENKKLLRHKKKQQSWPMILLAIGGLLLVMGAIYVFKYASEPATIAVTGAPSLKVDKDKVDLGNVKLGLTVEVDINITNVGDQPLRFNEAPYIEVIEGC